jgi:hypothetical protein
MNNRLLNQHDDKSAGINLYGEECMFINILIIYIIVHDELDKFYDKYRSLIWITYRYNFRPLLIEKIMLQGRKVQNLTSDNNWGCTIRAA